MKKRPETIVERRLKEGALVLKTCSQDAPRGAFWTFADTGRAARADVCDRLVSEGLLKPRGDGLFPDHSQTWGFS